ncbi:MAG: BamA/TamA family outer membrane protein, partial [Pseudomonadales bacterium]|nr:BamA/TamA family outer membrane protein [Pseudomonadales bacterium]
APVSTASFLQGEVRAELALPLGKRSRALTRVELGGTLADALAGLPPSVRYFAGGDRSIRGYGLDDLGPLDDNGEVSGGRNLVVGSLELERLVYGNWSLATFVDSGGAFNDFTEPVSTGVGVGVRWHSPFGPVRIDLAVPLDDPSRSVRLHLGVGSTFQ